ncbi:MULTISPECIES: hypothetical protein [unclassified Streptomyces]|uniref:hypothetical protein n=1 Tax=unclassified Streptomyces TaxID=2593676 RepID=UPI00382F027E
MDTARVPPWPLYRLTAEESGTVTVTGPAAPGEPHPDRAAAVTAVAAIAAGLTPPRPVRAQAQDLDGTLWPLIIGPDGTAAEDGAPTRPRRTRTTKRAAGRRTPAPAAPFEEPSGIPGAPAEPEEERQVLSGVQQLLAQAHARQNQRKEPAPPSAPAVPAAPVAAARVEPIPTLLTIRRCADAGDLDRAAELARLLDDAVSAAHGPSHPSALEARTLRADVSAARGEATEAIALYRDIAERHMYAGDSETADQIADRAHTLWQQIDDPRTAAAIGPAIVRMRGHIPGRRGGYAHAQQLQAYLEHAVGQGRG